MSTDSVGFRMRRTHKPSRQPADRRNDESTATTTTVMGSGIRSTGNKTSTARATTLAIMQKIAKTSIIGLEWVRLRIHPLMAALINAKRQKQEGRRVPSDECGGRRRSEIPERSTTYVVEDDCTAHLALVRSPLPQGGDHEGHDRLLWRATSWKTSAHSSEAPHNACNRSPH
jgi:hypothetical protein